ncbi:MAG: molecular chaperone HtpG [Chitinophagales bacterium]|jgi:molecular chaperone HtpG|nr:molecular chaperone HtpG [Chitinophagales bacterium]
MNQGKINVQVENIFPLIKKFLYSDHDIFLRELVSNATDATTKLKHLVRLGQSQTELGEPIIDIKINETTKTIHIIDQGLGMSYEEVEKYINQVAFSGAEEFLNQYKEKVDNAGIIGHFGLGFYSAFMVSDKVEIFTQSHDDSQDSVHWSCEGQPEYTMTKIDKRPRGTEIVLHINEESQEFLQESKIKSLLEKYNKFMPIPIRFGTKKISEKDPSDETKTIEKEVDNFINNPNPAWTKAPSELKDEDYKSFYRELYPFEFKEPLFHIHLNVDYPFNLTGILYFPSLKGEYQMPKDKIQLYQNQVYVTDSVEDIVPEFLTMLRGVIDSPDIPLNVSRSYLQQDGNVKKIATYITKKVGEKLQDIFKNQRKELESKWEDIKIIIEYGMLTDTKFNEKALDFYLFQTTEGESMTMSELRDKTAPIQTDKDGKLVLLYCKDKTEQHAKIAQAKALGYCVLEMNNHLSAHLMQKLESEQEKIVFKRVDADTLDKLIEKDEKIEAVLSEAQINTLKEIFEKVIEDKSYQVEYKSLPPNSEPMSVTIPEFFRRMQEMQMMQNIGGASMPQMYQLVVNTNHSLYDKILKADESLQKEMIQRGFDLARLSIGALKGEELTAFINKGFDSI